MLWEALAAKAPKSQGEKKNAGNLKTENREDEDYENKAAQAASVPALSGGVTRRGQGITIGQPR